MDIEKIKNNSEWLRVNLKKNNSVVKKDRLSKIRNKPKWLRVKLPIGKEYRNVRNIVDDNNLHTICQSGNCPNMGECWGAGTATFMILGNICTRSCGFCSVATGRPLPVDWNEPYKPTCLNLLGAAQGLFRKLLCTALRQYSTTVDGLS